MTIMTRPRKKSMASVRGRNGEDAVEVEDGAIEVVGRIHGTIGKHRNHSASIAANVCRRQIVYNNSGFVFARWIWIP
jgi:hypothetical protein